MQLSTCFAFLLCMDEGGLSTAERSGFQREEVAEPGRRGVWHSGCCMSELIDNVLAGFRWRASGSTAGCKETSHIN